MLFLAGDLTQWHLPVGMKDLRLSGSKVKGKVTSLIINMVYAPSPRTSFVPHFLFIFSLVALCSFSQVTLRSGIFPWA